MLKVYRMNIEPLLDEAVFEEKIKLVRCERQEKIRALRGREDRCRCLAAGLLLKEALTEAGVSYMDAGFSYGKNGKPYLSDKGSGEIYFSISHAGYMAVCVISDREVGADIERLDRFDGKEEQAGRIAKRIMTEGEWNLWQKNPTGGALVLLWTKKESYAKFTGEGLSCNFSAVDTMSGLEFTHPEIPEGYAMSVYMG
jgi:4'-phosphopantetheinyl transferase